MSHIGKPYTIIQENSLRKNTEAAHRELREALFDEKPFDQDSFTTAAALLLRASTQEDELKQSFEKAAEGFYTEGDEISFPDEIARVLRDKWNKLAPLAEKYSSDVFALLIWCNEFTTVPEHRYEEGIEELAFSLLNIQDGEKIADLYSGSAEFIFNTHLAGDFENTTELHAFENRSDFIPTFKARTATSGRIKTISHIVSPYKIKKEFPGMIFDKIFSCSAGRAPVNDSPFFRYGESSEIPEIDENRDNWYYAMLLTELLSEKGKAITFVSAKEGSSYGQVGERAQLIEKGLLEAAVILPGKGVRGNTDYTMMLILSRGNEKTCLVDASKICKSRNDHGVAYTTDDISAIKMALKKETSISRFIDKEAFRKNCYSLNVVRYRTLEKFPDEEQETAFLNLRDYIKGIKRGITLRPYQRELLLTGKTHCVRHKGKHDVLDNVCNCINEIKKGTHLNTSEEPEKEYTSFSLIVQHKRFGPEEEIKKDYTCKALFKEADFLEPYRVRDYDLLISRTGAPFYAGLVHPHEDEKLYIDRDFYAVTLDLEKLSEKGIHPNYIEAWLNSPEGEKQLNALTTVSIRPEITPEAISTLKLPLKDPSVMKIIAAKYALHLTKQDMLEEDLDYETEKLRNTFHSSDYSEFWRDDYWLSMMDDFFDRHDHAEERALNSYIEEQF